MYAAVIVLCTPTIISHQILEFPRDWSTAQSPLPLSRTLSGSDVRWYPTCMGPNVTAEEYRNDTSYAVYTIDTSELALRHNCVLYKANLWLTGIMFKFVPCVFLVFLSTSLLTRFLHLPPPISHSPTLGVNPC